ncbi:MAG TPA: exosortase/archaeosortase family protein [Gemmataceae bacterium]|nr:exosortase/archaeosortase family protein [Gemmataceae bacterium]
MNTTAPTNSLSGDKENIAANKATFGLAVFLLLLAALFYDRLLVMASVWLHDGNYSHGFLIIEISAFLAYRAFKKSSTPMQPEPGFGSVTMIAGLMLLLGSTVLTALVLVYTGTSILMVLQFIALAIILRGAAVVIGGRTWAGMFTFPILFLFFMFPLPVAWTNFASVWLQDWVSWTSGHVLEVFFVCHQQGNQILIAGATEPIFVAQECSGLRQLVAFLALATLVGYLSNRGLVSMLLLVAAAIPVAILSNVMRVLLMALAIRYLGPQSVSGWMHDVPAFITLPVGLVLFFGLQKLIGSFFAPSAVEPTKGDA